MNNTETFKLYTLKYITDLRYSYAVQIPLGFIIEQNNKKLLVAREELNDNEVKLIGKMAINLYKNPLKYWYGELVKYNGDIDKICANNYYNYKIAFQGELKYTGNILKFSRFLRNMLPLPVERILIND